MDKPMSSNKARNECEQLEAILNAIAESSVTAQEDEIIAEASETADARRRAEQTRELLLRAAKGESGSSGSMQLESKYARLPAFAEGDVVQRKNQADAVGIIRRARWNSQTEGW